MAAKFDWQKEWKAFVSCVDKAKVSLYDAILQGRKLLKSPEFKFAMEGKGSSAVKEINGKLSEIGHTWGNLDATFTKFPNRKQWEKGSLVTMIKDALAAEDKKRRESKNKSGGKGKPRSPKRTASIKELDDAKQTIKEYKVKYESAKEKAEFVDHQAEMIKELRDRIKELIGENTELRQMVKDRDARIRELEDENLELKDRLPKKTRKTEKV